jgi:branched-chain amino acid transport system permease protein
MRYALRGVLALGLLALAVIPLVVDEFWLQLATVIVLYALAATGLDLTFGRGGLLSLGHAAFFGTGVYTVALIDRSAELPGFLLLVAAVLASALAGVLVGLVSLRVAGFYFALLTLAAAIILESLIRGLETTGGPSGIAGVSRNLLGTGQLTAESLYALCLVILAVGIAALRALRNSRSGRAMEALRSQEATATACGVDVFRLRLRVFVVGAGIAGLAGGLFAMVLRYASPEFVGLNQSIEFLIMTVIGGLGTIWGVLVGAVVVRGIPELVQDLRLWQLLAVGALTLLVLLRFRLGVAGTIESAIRRRRLARAARAEEPVPEASDVPPADVVGPTSRRAAGGSDAPLLELRGISRRFGGLLALDGVELDVLPGQIHSLVGPNGAGKTTLVNIISGIDRPTSGVIALHGADVTALPAHRRAGLGLARTFQLVGLVDTLTLLENTMLGAYSQGSSGLFRGTLFPSRQREEQRIRQASAAALARLGLGSVAHLLPGEVSIGQRRLTEVARCLVSGAELLLLDEPAAGLNETETRALGQRLREISASGTAILLIEHDMPLVMDISEQITVLNFGRRIAVGTPAEVSRDPEVIAAYLGGEVPSHDHVGSQDTVDASAGGGR